MEIIVVLAGWTLVSVMLAGAWAVYRRFIGRHSLESFDVFHANDDRPQVPSSLR